MGSLSGGEKDTTPPEVVNCSPNNASVNFYNNEFTLSFNEYVKLNNINEKLIISPPLNEQPEVILKGKKVQIKFKTDSLLPNTTYNFNFSDAIADNNENNAMSGFVYAFSTGSVIDSLQMSGTVIDAYTMLPVEGVYVSLYQKDTDSLFNTQRPDYLGRTDKNGWFSIPFLSDNVYNIYAIKDENYNYLFDQATEPIAFLDYKLRPRIVLDTLDSDSLITRNRFVPDSLELLLFAEDHLLQYITDIERKTPQTCKICFARPNIAKPLFFINDKEPKDVEYSQEFDTVQFWFAADSLFKHDSIQIICRYVEPLFSDSVRTDSIWAIVDSKSSEKQELKMVLPKDKEIFNDYSLSFNNPISQIDTSLIKLYYKEDSIEVEQQVNFVISGDNNLSIVMHAKITSGEKYKLEIGEGAITDVFGFSSSADSVNINAKTEEDYGHLVIEVPSSYHPSVVAELIINKKVKYRAYSKDNKIRFDYIKPGEYSIRLLEDFNDNGKWDTGDFKMRKQPEPVYYYSESYEIRNNWQHELIWQIQKRNVY